MSLHDGLILAVLAVALGDVLLCGVGLVEMIRRDRRDDALRTRLAALVVKAEKPLYAIAPATARAWKSGEISDEAFDALRREHEGAMSRESLARMAEATDV